MVRVIVIFLFLTTYVWAGFLQDKIESFMGGQEYRAQKNLILVLFKDENMFMHEDGSVDDIKVLDKLKRNGLLKLFYKDPQKLNLSFVTKENPLIFMRVINESLSSMGYNYFLTKRAKKSTDEFVWDIAISTEHIVDPLILSKKLKARGGFLESVQRVGKNRWRYTVNTDNIQIEAKTIEANKTVKLNKPIKPYWVVVEGMKTISLESKLADRWHPSLVFYNKKLDIIKDHKENKVANRLKIKIPIDAKYVKISDMHTLDNIKRGVSVHLSRRD